MKSKVVRGAGFTSPIGRGRRTAPGEALHSIDRPYPLTPTLSPWEREQAAVAAAYRFDSGRGEVR